MHDTTARDTSLPRYDRTLILIHLKGGNDGLNTVIPYTNSLYRQYRPTLAISRDRTLPISETQAFHPSLEGLMPLWQAGELAVVQGIGYEDTRLAHYRSLEIIYTGSNADEYLDTGWLSRQFIAYPASERVWLDGIAFGPLDVREADPMGPFRGNQTRFASLDHANEWLVKYDISACQGRLTTAAKAVAVKPAQIREQHQTTIAFPNTDFGTQLRAAVELIDSKVNVPVIHLCLDANDNGVNGTFDTHKNQLRLHGNILKQLGDGFLLLKAALSTRGHWQNTLVVTYDEYGRRVKENEIGGTEHGAANTHFVAGGNVRGGLYGQAPRLEHLNYYGCIEPVLDYRRLYATILENWWGTNSTHVLRGHYQPLAIIRA